jgi:hypothetical protein
MISVKFKGNFKSTETYLKKLKDSTRVKQILESAGKNGVELLKAATPSDSGETAASWDYNIYSNGNGRYEVRFTNSNVVKGVPIAIILQYGHATGTGGYVQGRDYMNPALQKAFEQMRNELIKEVRST